ncbi:MAG: mycofactocin precursor MftA [Streptosporangiaceae bacterium]
MAETTIELVDPPADQLPETAEVAAAADTQPAQLIAADLLVEEISIDGMCGVY